MSSNGWKINTNCIDWIRTNIEKGSSILELGSGPGSTPLLVQDYDLYSIEQNQDYVGVHSDSTYLYSSLIKEAGYWYDIDLVNEFVEGKSFSCILVDGPAAPQGVDCARCGLYDNIKSGKLKLNTKCVWIFDDTNRSADMDLAVTMSEFLGKKLESFHDYSIINL